MGGVSETMRGYFGMVQAGVDKAYSVANTARQKGYDPDDQVSIPLARNMAERVEGIVSIAAPQIKGAGISERIVELEREHGAQDWRVAFTVALETAKQNFCRFGDEREAMEVGLRVGLAYLTNGVVSSPLEGFIRLELKERNDGAGKFFSLYFGGPIRSAGTTATCAFVALSDYVRSEMGYQTYDPTPDEIKRSASEIDHFHDRITNLQYHPSNEEAEFLTAHLPLQIEGDPSEKIEVLNYKDLPRVSTNLLRNGYCLALAEGLSLKLPKFWGKFSKWYKEFNMKHWGFVAEYVSLQKEIRSRGEKGTVGAEKVKPDYGYVKDIVAGRPVLGHPMRGGAFRLRYGRTRTSGFSVDALHPATMHLLGGFVALGTQLKVERPGKATVITSCDTVEGPIVKLKDGSVVFVDSLSLAKEIQGEVQEIIFAGDVLINYGDFLDRAHVLVPPGYCEEWWVLELEKACNGDISPGDEKYVSDFTTEVSCAEAVRLSREYDIPLHPRHVFHWNEINVKQFIVLLDWLHRAVVEKEPGPKIILPLSYRSEDEIEPKRILELIGLPHTVTSKEYVLVEGDWAGALMANLGFYEKDLEFVELIKSISGDKTILEIIGGFNDIKIRDKSGLFIGSRMGRPEKGKMRKLTGSPHALFPIGEEGGRLRSFQSALEKGKVSAEFCTYFCPACKKETIYPRCHICDELTERKLNCPTCGLVDDCEHNPRPYRKMDLNIGEYFGSALKKAGMTECPDLIKGVRGTSNKEHIPEHLVKGILRAKHNVFVNKDGTTRYDMTETTCTHFKPFEIATSVEKLKQLGYVKDVYGEELVSDDQVLELRCQDIILPSCPDSLEEGADIVLFRVANFLDDLLSSFYGIGEYFKLKERRDIVGHLVVGLSPHTASGIVGRIIGFSKTQGLVAHPFFHSIMRRDCDGDEAGIMLLMDALLNFSPRLLSDHRGATQDEPLVLTSVIIPSEVDDMVFNMDVEWKYPLEFYEACSEYKNPWEVKLDLIGGRLGKPEQFEGYGFTHPNTDFNVGVLCSEYKTIPTMEEKVQKQIALAEILRAVDESDVARLVIERHFMRDIRGNLRKFSMQQFRCVNCNEKYRRPPLIGRCLKCAGRIIFTISEGSVIKYLAPSLSLAEKYDVPTYLKQSLDLTRNDIESVFGKEKETQKGLGQWFG